MADNFNGQHKRRKPAYRSHKLFEVFKSVIHDSDNMR